MDDLSYARASDVAGLLEAPADELWQLTRELAKASRRLRWRRGHATRCSQVAAALRGIRKLLGDRYAGKEKINGGWLILARADGGNVPAIELSVPKPATWEEMGEPISWRVVRPELVSMEAIKRWQKRINEARRRRQSAA